MLLIFCSESLVKRFNPKSRADQYKHWEKFKPAGRHIKHQNEFLQIGEFSEIFSRSYQIKSGTYIINAAATDVKLVVKSKPWNETINKLTTKTKTKQT